ncbi:MAG: LytTR family DNA-binding domain-containing protein [Brevundimonas sp.]|uniref:LytTR family DNA-binding domain-containing protein n=1 Tax=Brevundimonas sp. TaxID=1871086 RepID=UPI0024887A3E|nr:LytTR family DNA-binding domain-containing protein [Brevundimonas sp.]MDI1325802.1 LytTR family DNA-binding domain-containing protein [Brevundimonas sp.]
MIETPNTARAWATELAACLGVGAVLGVIGPFGSFFNDVLVVRVAYWVCVFLVCGLAFGLAFRLLASRAHRAGVPAWAWVPAMALVVGIPLAGVTRLMAAAIWPAIRQSVGLVEWYGQTVLVGLVYVALYGLLRRRAAPRAALRGGIEPDSPRILRRLPPRLGQDLLCLSMEDHYVRLHTTRGSALVLMSLGQALEEVGGLEGLQVHRSWWVARKAVEGVIEDGRKLRIRLKGGIEAPVSRASVARLRAAGWLKDQVAGADNVGDVGLR